jgi:hypothetical protein
MAVRRKGRNYYIDYYGGPKRYREGDGTRIPSGSNREASAKGSRGKIPNP